MFSCDDRFFFLFLCALFIHFCRSRASNGWKLKTSETLPLTNRIKCIECICSYSRCGCCMSVWVCSARMCTKFSFDCSLTHLVSSSLKQKKSSLHSLHSVSVATCNTEQYWTLRSLAQYTYVSHSRISNWKYTKNVNGRTALCVRLSAMISDHTQIHRTNDEWLLKCNNALAQHCSEYFSYRKTKQNNSSISKKKKRKKKYEANFVVFFTRPESMHHRSHRT